MCIYKGKEYGSDTGRIIRKFDIYVCDLGEPTNNNLGKKRPCVIIQSDKINYPKQPTYLVAPIRTEHILEVTRETLENVVDTRRLQGRIYIPIEMSPNNFSFIDMTRIRTVHYSEILTYKNSIINPELKKRINATIRELTYDDEDYEVEYANEDIIEDDDIDDDYDEEVIIETDNEDTLDEIIETINNIHNIKFVTKSKLPEQFLEIYEKVVTKKMTMVDGASSMNLYINDFITVTQDYETDEAYKFDQWRLQNSGNAKPSSKRIDTPGEFIRLFVQWKAKMVTYNDFVQQLGLSFSTVTRRISEYKKYKEQEFQNNN